MTSSSSSSSYTFNGDTNELTVNPPEWTAKDYRTLAPLPLQKLINKTTRQIRPVFFCPLCSRKHDVQDPHYTKQELANHLYYGHEEWEMTEWLTELDQYAELRRGMMFV